MKVTDMLAPKIRPHTFMLPNTDAGGGVGYDDMLPEHYNNLSKPKGIYACKGTYRSALAYGDLERLEETAVLTRSP